MLCHGPFQSSVVLPIIHLRNTYRSNRHIILSIYMIPGIITCFQEAKTIWQKFHSSTKSKEEVKGEKVVVRGEFFMTDTLSGGRNEREQRMNGTNDTLLFRQKHSEYLTSYTEQKSHYRPGNHHPSHC